MERPESHQQLQDPIPQHWGQSTTGWRPEQVILPVWKAKAWSDTPHPLWPSHNTAINTLPLPPLYCFSACTQNLWRWCNQSLQETEDKEAQMVSLQPASKPVLSSYHSSSHWSSIDHWSCVKSPPASNAPPSSLYPSNQKSQDLMITDLLL